MFRTKHARFSFLLSLLLVCRGPIASGQTLTTLWQFGSLSNDADGGNSWSGLIQGRDGNFYGTSGGTAVVHCTVFKITPQGTLTTLWQFGSLSNNVDGNSPVTAGLVQGRDGSFYGTTSNGGTNTHFGTVFKITSAGTLTPLWQFGSLSNNLDGVGPWGGLIEGSDGNFYGTTVEGGAYNHGTVFQITSNGSLTNLYSFGGFPNDGQGPFAGVVQGSDANFYGTTGGGGSNNEGTVFKITSTGTLTTIWQFGSLSNDADGKWPEAGLIQGSDGDFYGTTQAGGTSQYNPDGTVFKITSSGALTPLWEFGGIFGVNNVGHPSGLTQGSDGNFYGTTLYDLGTIFKITPAGTLTMLWQFSNSGGSNPMAELIQGCDGSFYGATPAGGTNDQGTIFKLTIPLNPPANQISSVSMAGSNIVFAIPSAAHETYQLQCSTDLTSGIWSNICGAYVSNSVGALLTFTNFGGACAPQGFYRFDITP
jgi:uncharacterized repeat protein (TIGR03803 family)